MFSKITQWLGSFRESSTENFAVNQNLLTREKKYNDPTASAETAELVLGNLGQQFAARNVQSVQSIKPNGTATKDGGYLVSVHPQELGIGRWSKEVNPNTVTTKAVEKVLDDFGIKDNGLREKAITKLGDNDLTIELGKEKAKRLIKTGDFGERDLMLVTTNNLGGVNVKFDVEQINWLKGLAKLEKVNELVTKAQSNQPLKTEPTLLGTTAVLNLPKAIELPKLDARPLLILGAEAAVPAASIGVTAGGVAWTSYQIGEMGYRKWETQTRADALPLPPPPILTNKAEEPVKPETTVADKPKPQAQPIPDEADLPKGEIAVRPKAQPQTQPKADNPTGATENVPSPYKPNQPNSPQFDPTKMIPPIIGAGAATVGKISTDKVNSIAETNANQTFVGTLRGEAVMLKNVEMRQIQYTKRTPEAREALRKEFDRHIRSDFLKSLANNPQKVTELKASGINDDGINRMKDGRNPKGWQVHHKLPIDDGGDNSFDNLVLIKNDPYHLTITNQQNSNTKDMKAGETKIIDWVIPPGFVYPREEER